MKLLHQRRLEGCIACGLWDKDEDGRLMCCCGPERYAEMQQLVADELARGAAPALATSQTIRELTGKS